MCEAHRRSIPPRPLKRRTEEFRGVAQSGRALRSGRRGPRFESGRPDTFSAYAAMRGVRPEENRRFEPSGPDDREKARGGSARRVRIAEGDRSPIRAPFRITDQPVLARAVTVEP